jgi:arylsulfatase A-like enzyme
VTVKNFFWKVWFLLFLLLCAACGRPPVEAGLPNVLLISIDALRADHLSCYGYDRHTSPALDKLAAQGTRFSNAFVNTQGTPPPHTTLLSSLYQENHRVGIESDFAAGRSIPSGVQMVQEIFAGAGWHTMAVTGGGYMSSQFKFSRGFDEYIDLARGVDQGTEFLLEYVRGPVEAGRPVFVFLHTYEVHSPYDPPEGFRQLFGEHSGAVRATSEALLEIQKEAAEVLTREDFKYLESLYDGGIRYTDEVIGRLLVSLETLGFLNNAIVVVTSDHGEEFGEHGGVLHGGTLFEELLHVPLIIGGAGADRGVVDPSLVSLVDIAPTLLSLAGLEIPDVMEGRIVFDRPASEKWQDQRVFAQYGDRLYCARTPRWKLIQRTSNQRVKLFDLHRDPGEHRNLSAQRRDLSTALLAELEDWRVRRPQLDVGSRRKVELTEEMIEDLRALGYVE